MQDPGCGKILSIICQSKREEKSFLDLAKKMLAERINGHEFENNGIKIKFKKVKRIAGDVLHY